MKVGDLIALKLCGDVGKVGMITEVGDASYLGKSSQDLRLYWVLTDKGNQCYTGTQLIRRKWMVE